MHHLAEGEQSRGRPAAAARLSRRLPSASSKPPEVSRLNWRGRRRQQRSASPAGLTGSFGPSLVCVCRNDAPCATYRTPAHRDDSRPAARPIRASIVGPSSSATARALQRHPIAAAPPVGQHCRRFASPAARAKCGLSCSFARSAVTYSPASRKVGDFAARRATGLARRRRAEEQPAPRPSTVVEVPCTLNLRYSTESSILTPN